jgi:hypothetical protein
MSEQIFHDGLYSCQGGMSDFITAIPAGLWGESSVGYGVIGASNSGSGVFAWAKAGGPKEPAYALFAKGDGEGAVAAFFQGSVVCDSTVRIFGDMSVGGTLSKSAGQFKIDHPLDPANKYLAHSFVESPDMKNIYDGVVVLNTKGEAVVELPAWFESLNQDFRYQLTPLGAPAPNLYIAEEIIGNRFKIGGGEPGRKVSWQVTGIRHDVYANAHRLVVEEDKAEMERACTCTRSYTISRLTRPSIPLVLRWTFVCVAFCPDQLTQRIPIECVVNAHCVYRVVRINSESVVQCRSVSGSRSSPSRSCAPATATPLTARTRRAGLGASRPTEPSSLTAGPSRATPR